MASSDRQKDRGLEEYLDLDEADSVKAAMAYILIKSTDMDADAVYSLVFEEGKKIIWH